MVFVIYFSGKGYEQIRPRGYVTVGQGEIFFLLCYCTIVLIRTFFTHSAPGNGVYFLSSTAVPLWSNIQSGSLQILHWRINQRVFSICLVWNYLSPPLLSKDGAAAWSRVIFGRNETLQVEMSFVHRGNYIARLVWRLSLTLQCAENEPVQWSVVMSSLKTPPCLFQLEAGTRRRTTTVLTHHYGTLLNSR